MMTHAEGMDGERGICLESFFFAFFFVLHHEREGEIEIEIEIGRD